MKDLDIARQRLKKSVFSYVDVVNNKKTLDLETESGVINIPLNHLGWDYTSIPGLKLMSKHGSEVDVLYGRALENVVIPRHKSNGTSYYVLHEGAIKDVEKGVDIPTMIVYKIESEEWHEIYITKGSIFTITFKPKLEYE